MCYLNAMTDTPPPDKPISPWKLTPGRILLLVMGILLIIYTASALMGGMANYQTLKDAATTAQDETAQ